MRRRLVFCCKLGVYGSTDGRYHSLTSSGSSVPSSSCAASSPNSAVLLEECASDNARSRLLRRLSTPVSVPVQSVRSDPNVAVTTSDASALTSTKGRRSLVLPQRLMTEELTSAFAELHLEAAHPPDDAPPVSGLSKELECLQEALLVCYLQLQHTSKQQQSKLNAMQRVSDAFRAHPSIVSLFASAPSWDKLSCGLGAPDRDDAHAVLLSCASSVLLSLCTLFGKMDDELGRVGHCMSPQWWDAASRIVCVWVLHQQQSRSQTTTTLPQHRTHHLVRSTTRLCAMLKQRSEAHQLQQAERIFAGAVVALLCASLEDAAAIVAMPDRALLHSQTMSALYSDVFAPIPNRVERQRSRNITQHAAFNARLVASGVIRCDDVDAESVQQQNGRTADASLPLLVVPMVLQEMLIHAARCWVVEVAVLQCLEQHAAVLTRPAESTTRGGGGSVLSKAWQTKVQRRLLSVALAVEGDVALMVMTQAPGHAPHNRARPWTPQPLPVSLQAFRDIVPAAMVDVPLSPMDDKLAQLRRALAKAVRTIVLRLTIPEAIDATNNDPRKEARSRLMVPVQVSPFSPKHFSGHQRAPTQLMARACVFLHQLRHTFGSLARRHYAASHGTEVLQDAVAAFFIAAMAGEQVQPIAPRAHDPQTISTCPSSHTIGEAMEMMFFATILQQQQHSAQGSSDAFQGAWWEPSRRLLQFVVDALVHNSCRFDQEVSRGMRSPPAFASDMILPSDSQLRFITIRGLSLCQAIEWLVVLRHYCGVLPASTPANGDNRAVESGDDAGLPQVGVQHDVFSSLAAPQQRHEQQASHGQDARPNSIRSNLAELRLRLARRVQDLLKLGARVQEHAEATSDASAAKYKASSKYKQQKLLSHDPRSANGDIFTDGSVLEHSLLVLEAPAAASVAQRGSLGGPTSQLARYTLLRMKLLSVLAAELELNFNVREERQQRRNQRGAQRVIPSHINGQEDAATNTLQMSGPVMVATVQRTSPSEPLGVNINDACDIVSVTRSSPFATALAQLGWYPEECVGGTLRIVAVNRQRVRHVRDFRSALLDVGGESQGDRSIITRLSLRQLEVKTDKHERQPQSVSTLQHNDDDGEVVTATVTHRRAVPPSGQLSAVHAAAANLL